MGACYFSETSVTAPKIAIRIIVNAYPRDHFKPPFSQSGINTMYSLFVFKALCYVRENLDYYSHRPTVHNYGTRSRNNLNVDHSRLSL
jgi:hypothetical protein